MAFSELNKNENPQRFYDLRVEKGYWLEIQLGFSFDTDTLDIKVYSVHYTTGSKCLENF